MLVSLLKPISPTQSNTRSPRSFHNQTEAYNDLSDRKTSCNPHKHTLRWKNILKWVHRVSLILYSIRNTAINRQCALFYFSTRPVEELQTPLTTRTRSGSRASHSKTIPRKHHSWSNLSLNTRHDFLVIPSL